MTGPLDGVRVLELCEGVAGPWCAMQLGDAGADVVKIEPPEGDFARRLGPPFERGESVLFLALNRSKRGVVLDLNLPDGRSQLRALLGTADILLHDRTPAAAAALGLDEAALRAEHPRLVVCALTDFGPEGPWRERLGSELVAQAAAECPASLGRLGEHPVRLGADVAGAATAFFAFQAVLAALIERERTGRGQSVAVSALGALLHLRGILWCARADPDEWYGFHLDSATKPPDHGYETADRPLYFSLGRGSAEEWDRLLAELDLVDALADPRFA